jgi:uncharacterized MnhB-related membrane protein
MVLQILIVAVTLVCAFQALRTRRLLISALWLAGTSALVALMIYLLGAPEVAVVELSVGAGLVTILFVFAINIAGEETLPAHSLIPRPLAWGLVIVAVLLLGWFTLPRLLPVFPAPDSTPFSQVVWEQRGLDMLLQVALIFTGVLGVVGLLVDQRRPSHAPEGFPGGHPDGQGLAQTGEEK